MQGPCNYDFGAYWETEIVPHLDNPKIQKAIRDGVNWYLKESRQPHLRYKKNTAPASYSSRDGYARLIMGRREDQLEDDLRKRGKLPLYFTRAEKKFVDAHEENSPILSEKEWDKIEDDIGDARDRLTAHLYKWDNIKYNLETYFFCGACHWYNPTFCLTLARLVEPDENWHVLDGIKHTTVVNYECSKVFDLLYWCDKGRLGNHVFGDEVREQDETLGGYAAFWDAIER
jgi:hypothetical protein